MTPQEIRKILSDRMKRLWAEGFYQKYQLGRGIRQRYYPHKTNKFLIIDIWK